MPFQTAATIYCERGSNPAFWAEPLNAATNVGFIVAALAGAVLLARRSPEVHTLWPAFFIVNFITIGIGSFFFHTMPSVRTAAADTGPIGVFMLAYLIFAMRRLVGASWFMTAAAVAAFVGCMVVAFNIQCWDGRLGFMLDNVPPEARARCLNGSLGYAPACLAMMLIAGWLAMRRHPGARLVFSAAVIFALSMTFRSVDKWLCDDWIVMGHRLGTHFLWHLLNSLTLFLLLLAAIKYGSGIRHVLPPRPRQRSASCAVS